MNAYSHRFLYASDIAPSQVILFGRRNARLIECIGITIPEPRAEAETNTQRKDLSALLAKKPTLPNGHTITLQDRFEIRIEKVKFIHHKVSVFEWLTASDRGDRVGSLRCLT